MAMVKRMSVRLEKLEHQLLVIHVTAMVHQADAHQLRLDVFDHVQQYGTFRLLIVLDQAFEGLNPAEDWTQDTFEDEWLQQQVAQIAIIGEPHWADHALLFFLSGIVPAPIKFFPRVQESLARAWLGDERYLAAHD
jgi:hypothetical protein